MAIRVSRWLRTATSSSACESAPRLSMPITPWATAGKQILGSRRAVMRDSSPSRIKPAQASTMASMSPASSRRSLVSTLPRRVSTFKSGQADNSCEHRRDGEVLGKSARQILHRMHGDIGASLLEGHLEFLDEQPLPADGGQGP